MAKIIKLTPEIIDSVKEQITKSLSQMKLSDGKLTFSQSFDSLDRKATIYFSEVAWAKMISLIYSCDKEIAWHGLAKRGEDETKDDYIIYDLLIYPQEVTGATVTTDQEKYQTWLYNRPDEEFNHIRMQGHSHVNMGTTPSSVDTTFYDRILEQLSDDMFYIFMIWNKRGEKTIKLYDMKKNVLFETKDCEVRVADTGLGIRGFMQSAGEMVVERNYSYSSNTNKPSTPAAAPKPAETKKELKPESKKEDNPKPATTKTEPNNGVSNKKDSNVSLFRKGKRKKQSSSGKSYKWDNEKDKNYDLAALLYDDYRDW